ncbi:hypothetical protein J7E99_08915 [Streptomyces sp. ISL-44]|uniref:hypothetical protein n=1 Tax=Streptomyces sp. ISL-44 TaxID=2819184 RepID=UPI001BEA367E|nr:hypothetical protein [Streptomyces sp. ISL-44]MBT2540820.1 hypothetical protein [Streptomyces sp. ISL-44]
MARLYVDGDDLVVRTAWWERPLARHGDVRVPLASVADVGATADWWRPLRGVRARGTLIPGALCLGLWEHATGVDFVAIRHRHHGVVHADLRPPSRFARIVVSGPRCDRVAATVREAMERAGSPAPAPAPAPAGAPEGATAP